MPLKPTCSRAVLVQSAAGTAVLLLFLSGCRGAGPEAAMPVPPEMPEPPAAPEVDPEPAAGPLPPGRVERPARAVLYDSLAVWIDVPDTVPRGEPVPVDMYTVNVSRRTLQVTFQGLSKHIFEVVVTDREGKLVWRRSYEFPHVAIGFTERMAPGDTVRGREIWDQVIRTSTRSPGDELVPPGTYRVQATTGRWHPAPVEVVIREPR